MKLTLNAAGEWVSERVDDSMKYLREVAQKHSPAVIVSDTGFHWPDEAMEKGRIRSFE